MDFIITTFNNREKAILFWSTIVMIWALSDRKFRASVVEILRLLTHAKIIIPIIGSLLYIALIVYAFYRIKLWDVSFIKDTAFWALGTAIIFLANSNKANQDSMYFSKLIFENIRLVLILEFIINLYVFNFIVELILLPFLFTLVFISVISEYKKELLPAKKPSNFILGLFGLFLLVFSIYSLIADYRSLALLDSLRSILLPPLLTIAFLPFIYCFALCMAYESLFVRLDIFLSGDKELAKFAKKRIFRLCILNLRNLNKFSKENALGFSGLSSKKDVLNMIQHFHVPSNRPTDPYG